MMADNYHADPDNQPDIEDMRDCSPPDFDPADTFDAEVHDHGTGPMNEDAHLEAAFEDMVSGGCDVPF